MTRERNKGRRGGSGDFERGWRFQLSPNGTDGRRRADFTGLRSPGGVGPNEMPRLEPSPVNPLQIETPQIHTSQINTEKKRCDEPTDSSN